MSIAGTKKGARVYKNANFQETKTAFTKTKIKNQMPQISQKRKVVVFITKTAEVERKLQIIKQTLSEVPTFTPASLFHRLDISRKNYLTEKDIEDFLIEAEVDFNASQMKTLFGRIDMSHSERVSLREFQNFILPNQDPRLRYETGRRPILIPQPEERLCKEVEHLAVKLFTQITKQYTNLATAYHALKSSYDLDSSKIFEMLSCGSGYITGESISEFVNDNGGQLTNEEIGCLVSTIDRKGIAKISSEDFEMFLAAMDLKKAHQIFNDFNPFPGLQGPDSIKKGIFDREQSLKSRYKDNKFHAKGMDEEAHHILGYSRFLDPTANYSKYWLVNGSRRTTQ